ncbi:hypothetical protein C8Q76DRAFT_437862 [Earliella scabrosa]|nr:hypothetical protein C8Q76DRAFT_437862 [Earliella scabrosa]
MSEYLRLVLAESFQWCTSTLVSIGTWTRIPYPVKYPCTHTGETHLFALLQPADKVTSMTSTIPTAGYPTEHSGVLPKFGVPFLSPSRGCEPHVECIKGPRRRLSLEVLRRHPTDHCGCTSRFELDEPRPMMLTTPLAAHETRPPRHPTPLILLPVARVRVEVKNPRIVGGTSPSDPTRQCVLRFWCRSRRVLPSAFVLWTRLTHLLDAVARVKTHPRRHCALPILQAGRCLHIDLRRSSRSSRRWTGNKDGRATR